MLNNNDIEYIEQAEKIIWKLSTLIKTNIETLEKIDRQTAPHLPQLQVKIEDAILMQMRTYQRINELFPRLEEIEETYVQNHSNELSVSEQSIKLYAPRIWNIINIVSRLKPASMKGTWRKAFKTNPHISLSASYIRKTKIKEQTSEHEAELLPADDKSLEAKYEAAPLKAMHHSIVTKNNKLSKSITPIVIETVDTSDKVLHDQIYQTKPMKIVILKGNKKYTDFLRSVGISGKIGQISLLETILTSSNLVLKRD